MRRIFISAMMLLCAASAAAQNEYNFQKRSMYEQLPVGRKDVVFLGNSITDYGQWEELFPGVKIKNRAISGDRTSWMLERLDPIVSGQPKKLFLMIGVNDLGAGVAPQTVAANIESIVTRFMKESPRTKIYVQSILPVNNNIPKHAKAHGSKDAEIVQTNAMIKSMCERLGLTYIDVHSALAGPDGKLRLEYTNDGLHLMMPGYLVWKDVIEKYVRK